MLLRNQDHYRDLLDIDVVRDIRQRLRIGENEKMSCHGVFFEHDDGLFGLGAESGAIFVIVNGKLLKYDDNVETQLEDSPGDNTFSVLQDSRPLITITYRPIKASGWIPNEDDECLDGFLWMHNVLRDEERRDLLIRNQHNDR